MNILNDNGYVVYTRKSNNPIWEYIRSTKEAETKNLLNQIPTANNDLYIEVGENLISLGKIERQKEINLIEKTLGIQLNYTEDAFEKEFIQKFNEVLIGKERYEAALQQIEMAVDQYQHGKKSLAPTISSLFLGKLNKYLVPEVRNYILTNPQKILNGDISDWEQIAEQALQNASEKALEELLTTTNKDGIIDIFGTYFNNMDLFLEYLNNTDNRDIFFQIVKSKVNLDRIKEIVSKNLQDIQSALASGKRKTYHKWIANSINTRARAGQVGGSINEFIMQLKQSVANTLNEAGRGGRVSESEMMKIDNILILTLDATIDARAMADEFSDEMLGSNNLIDAAKKMREYYDKHLQELSNSFVILTSGKAYGLNDFSHYGFKNDSKRGVGELRTILTYGPNAMTIEQAQNFIDVVINAMPGAVLNNKINSIKDTLRMEIFNSMAYLLFDDWIAIGNESIPNAIHAFNLNDVEVPLSSLLIGAGKAIKEASRSTRWFRTDIHYPKNVKYPSWKDYPTIKTSTKGDVPDTAGAWIEQRKDAYSSVSFTTHFLSNFTDEVLNLIE